MIHRFATEDCLRVIDGQTTGRNNGTESEVIRRMLENAVNRNGTVAISGSRNCERDWYSVQRVDHQLQRFGKEFQRNSLAIGKTGIRRLKETKMGDNNVQSKYAKYARSMVELVNESHDKFRKEEL